MRHTRREVLQRTQAEYRALDTVVAGLRPRDWGRLVPRPETRDPWTVKDALAHILYWKEHSVRVFRGERRPEELRGLEVNAINHLIYRRWHTRPPAEVVAWHRRVQTEVVKALADRPDEWFSGRERGPDWPADFDGHSAWHRIKDIHAATAPR